jgi:hypothetical protein
MASLSDHELVSKARDAAEKLLAQNLPLETILQIERLAGQTDVVID